MATNAIATLKLLVISGDPSVLRPIWSLTETNGWELEIAANALEAMDKVQSGTRMDLLLLDMPQTNGDGLYTLRWIRRLCPNLPVIVIGYSGDTTKREESIRFGAREYLYKPVDQEQLDAAIQRNDGASCVNSETDFTSDDLEVIGDGRFFVSLGFVMRKIRAQAAMLAEIDVPVLILGEQGSGKETIARLIHRLSLRSGFDFVRVKCAALPEDILERELFGHERSDASGSVRTIRGKVELCSKGSILLEEITEMPPRLQPNVLELLQNKRFVRPGSGMSIEADVRILATSSMGLDRAAFESRFGRELYQCLTTYSIYVPPLRERKQEIPLLASHLMHRYSRQYGLPPRPLSAEIIDVWQKYNWPGNLDEFEHFVKRYLMMGDKEVAFDASRASTKAKHAAPPSINESRMPGAVQALSPEATPGSKSLRSLIQSVKSEAERNAIALALEKTGWNRKAAARLLRVSYRTVLYKIEQYKMTASNSHMMAANNGTLNRAMRNGDNGNGH